MEDDHATSVSLAPAFRHRWDVFLSFIGEETRPSFPYNLCDSLEKHHVRVFFQDHGQQGGNDISPSLLEPIEDSAASIAIFSPNYASSSRCLVELSKICECRRRLLPVFYRVTPSDVRHQCGLFEEHIRNHEERCQPLSTYKSTAPPVELLRKENDSLKKSCWEKHSSVSAYDNPNQQIWWHRLALLRTGLCWLRHSLPLPIQLAFSRLTSPSDRASFWNSRPFESDLLGLTHREAAMDDSIFIFQQCGTKEQSWRRKDKKFFL